MPSLAEQLASLANPEPAGMLSAHDVVFQENKARLTIDFDPESVDLVNTHDSHSDSEKPDDKLATEHYVSVGYVGKLKNLMTYLTTVKASSVRTV